MRWCLISVLALGLSACALLTENTNLPNPFDVERPYEGKHRNVQAVRGITEGASILILPVAGVPYQHADRFAAALRDAAQAQDIPAVLENAADTADRLIGRAQALPDTVDPQIRIDWTLQDSEGRFLAEFAVSRSVAPPVPETPPALSLRLGFAGNPSPPVRAAAPQVPAPIRPATQEEIWESVPPALLTALATATASRLRRLMEEAQGRDPDGINNRGQVVVIPVIGAPGDGRASLTNSLAVLLREADLAVEILRDTDPRVVIPRDAVVVSGQVLVSPLPGTDPPAERITLTWTVRDHRGALIGSISQDNAIPAGSLDGPWGEAAFFAAQGARDGLFDLLIGPPR